MKRLGFCIGLAFALTAVPGRAESIRVTVLHTNDIHGWIMPRPAAFHAADPRRAVGGAAALAAYSKTVKGPKLLLDAGDWFQGTPEGGLRDGRAMAEVFNAVGYDVLEVGNHDFDNGEGRLESIIKDIRAPVLCANVYRGAGERAPECKPWIVKDVAGVKIGIFGLLTTSMKALQFADNIAGLAFRSPVEEAKEDVAALRAQGATVIIALSHLGLERPDGPPFDGDQTLAAQVDGIDLIVGGHSHTALPEGVRDATHGTLIVQAGSELTRVGEVSLEIDPASRKVVKSSARLVDLWPDAVGADPAVAKVVSGFSSEVDRLFDVVVATAAQPLARARGESPLGDWMADCERQWAHADLAIINGGGIRTDIPAGPVTRRQIYEIMPFNNRMVTLVMNGKAVKALLDQAAGRPNSAQISGAKMSFHHASVAGSRVAAVSVAGKPLAASATYRVATMDFLAKGGDGYTAFDLAQSKDFSQTLVRDVLNQCAHKQGLLKTPSGGRLVLLGD